MSQQQQLTFTNSRSNFHSQEFSFSKKLVNYISGDKANAKIIQKLYRTCKYFYSQKPYFIVDSLDFQVAKGRFESEEYDASMEFFVSNPLINIHNIWVTKEFKIDSALQFRHDLIPKIIRCTVKRFEILNVWFSKESLEILTKSGTIEELFCDNLIPGKSIIIPIEDILAMVPNAKRITYRTGHVTPETMSKLLLIPWRHKLEKFYLEKLDGPIDPELYNKFIKNHVAINGQTKIGFKFKNSREFQIVFNRVYNAIINKETQDLNSEFEPIAKKQKVCVYEKLKSDISTKFEIYFDETQSQIFPFCSTIMKYILQNAKGKIMKKLYKTCKYFKISSKFTIIDEIKIDQDDGTIIFIDQDEFKFNNVSELLHLLNDNIWITESFIFDIDDFGELSELITKIVRTGVKNVFIRWNGIKESEFQFFSKSKNLIHWHSNYSPIFVDDEMKQQNVTVEDLMPNLINAEEIALHGCVFTPQTFDKLLSLPWKNKLKELWFNAIQFPIDAEEFYEFLKIAIAPRAYVKVVFHEIVDGDYPDKFETAIKTKLDTWKPKREKPAFIVSYVEDSTMIK